MNINKKKLNEMGACNDVMRWFLKNFEGDAELKDVVKLLLRDGRDSDVSWLNRHLLMRDDIDIKALTEANVGAVIGNSIIADAQISNSENYARISSRGNHTQISSRGNHTQIASGGDYNQISGSGYGTKISVSGYSTKIGSSGDYAQIASGGNRTQISGSGNHTQIASGGDYTQIYSSGYNTKIASSGLNTQIYSSGNYAKITSGGNHTQIQAQGVNAVIAITGSGMAKAGDGGVIAIRWHDEQSDRSRIAVGYVGEDLKADTWYEVKKGRFVEVTR